MPCAAPTQREKSDMDYEFVPGRDDFPPDEIAMLRQQLAAALAAIELKDAALLNCESLIQECFGGGSDLEQVQLALDIKPDSSALKAHDEALIERCAKVCDRRTKTVSNGNGVCYRSHAPSSVAAEYCAAAIRELKN